MELNIFATSLNVEPADVPDNQQHKIIQLQSDDELKAREWESDLRFMKDMISDETTEDGDELEDMAREKIEAVYGSKGINQSYNELLKSQTPQLFPTTLKIFKDNVRKCNLFCYVHVSYQCLFQKCLLGDEEESENVFNVYTVSSQEHMNILKGRTAIMKENDTELPLLHEHIRNMVIQHSQKAEKDYITEVFGVLSYLTFSKDNEKVEEFNIELSVLLKNELDKVCENLVTFLNDVSENLESCLKDGVVEAEKMCIKSAMDEVIKPKMKNFRGYHRILKAVCRSNGSYSSSKGPIDLNYTLSRPMYTSVNKTFLQTFRNSRSSINIIFDNVLYDFISSERLNKYKSSKVYPQVVFVKTELKRILSELEKEIRYIKKSINNSLSDSIKKIMQPAYEEALKISGTHAFKKIQKTLEDRIESSQNTMFQRAKEEMLYRFDDLKKLVNNRIKEKMKESITLALNQSEVDETFPGNNTQYKCYIFALFNKVSCFNVNNDLFFMEFLMKVREE
ncbi:SLIP GTPase, partial [Atractosteus spatula]|nr:SLIP GTPase [Atractosteus spatula]